MMFPEKPEVFNSKFEVVSCFVEYDGKILLLHRQDHKPEGNTWGLPAGKVDTGEDIFTTTVREINEETGLQVSVEQIKHLGKFYVKYPEYDFVFHTLKVILETQSEVIINPKEHKACQWLSPIEALDLTLIEDLDASIKIFYKI